MSGALGGPASARAMPPGRAGGKAAVVLQCEWQQCSFVASGMEEFCGHVAQHLQQHLPAQHRDEMDPLGEALGRRRRRGSRGALRDALAGAGGQPEGSGCARGEQRDRENVVGLCPGDVQPGREEEFRHGKG